MTLEEFTAWWLRESPMLPPVGAYNVVNGNVGLTLYRDGPFQVQLWTFPPRAEIVDHKHPDVDTILVRVAGRFRLRRNGRVIPLRESGRAEWRGLKTWTDIIAAEDLHGVTVGPTGGAFLSITERKDGRAPESVHLVWEGAPLDERHAADLGAS
jgi:hypothetical protein